VVRAGRPGTCTCACALSFRAPARIHTPKERAPCVATDVCASLRRAQEKLSKWAGKFFPDSANKVSGNTGVHWACWYGRVNMLKMMVAAHADIHKRNTGGNTPLHLVRGRCTSCCCSSTRSV
jgi:hypothetical protein